MLRPPFYALVLGYLLAGCGSATTDKATARGATDSTATGRVDSIKRPPTPRPVLARADTALPHVNLAGDSISRTPAPVPTAALTPRQQREAQRAARRLNRQLSKQLTANKCQSVIKKAGSRVISVGSSTLTVAGQKIIQVGNINLTPETSAFVTERYAILDDLSVQYCRQIAQAEALHETAVALKLVEKQAEVMEKMAVLINSATAQAQGASPGQVQQAVMSSTAQATVK